MEVNPLVPKAQYSFRLDKRIFVCTNLYEGLEFNWRQKTN